MRPRGYGNEGGERTVVFGIEVQCTREWLQASLLPDLARLIEPDIHPEIVGGVNVEDIPDVITWVYCSLSAFILLLSINQAEDVRTLSLIRSERHSRPITISTPPILKANERTGNNKTAKRTTPPLRSPGLQPRFAELLKYSRVEDRARLLGCLRAYGELWSWRGERVCFGTSRLLADVCYRNKTGEWGRRTMVMGAPGTKEMR